MVARRLWLGWLIGLGLLPRIAAAEEPGFNPLSLSPTDWSLHAQGTFVGQGRLAIRSPYEGVNSLQAQGEFKETVTMTLFVGRKLWPGGELFVSPEVTQGTGLTQTLGIAAFPDGEATRANNIVPEISLARLFLRQTINLGGEEEAVAPDLLHFAGTRQTTHLILTFGKLAAPDIFDDNRYSHDPRTQFLSWALMDNGAWDYPADTKGYTMGGVIELEAGPFSVRYGGFMEPKDANGPTFDWNLKEAWGHTVELEGRYSVASRPGVARLLGYVNRSNAGSYVAALGQNPTAPDVTLTRTPREKYGAGLNIEQELTDDLGAFARLGWNDGHSETWAFTEIDRTVSLGLSLKGTVWSRPEDTFGVAAVESMLSYPHRHYLAAGGVGFIVGDGQLNYSPEILLETYYEAKLKWVFVTVDYQYVTNPAFNRDRGPVSIFGLRVHWER
jgi:high affinity Mn2+ porin